ncbi:MAG: NADH:flavin oxidoreductase [Promethearchaeota archaeon]
MVKIELKTLFSPERIGKIQIKNRIIRSATFTNMASKEGIPTEQQIEFYRTLAKGGTGLIFTEITSIDQIGRNSKNQLCLDDDSQIAGHRKLVNAVHEYSEVKIAPQLSHAGRGSFNREHTPVAPSPIFNEMTKKTPKELTVKEIREIVKNFVEASRRAYESGYDLIQLNAGHGWLLCNFLSPFTNKRTDEYGGDTQKRTRILIDIYNHVIDEVGKKFPITLKLQTNDFVPEGLKLEEGKEIAKLLVDTGYCAIEPSGGGFDLVARGEKPYPSLVVKTTDDENYFLPSVKKLENIKKNCPLILMGGVKNPQSAEKILQEKIADFISMSRPLIYEPDLPNRWKSGDLSPPLCTSCNQCYGTVLAGQLHCPIKKKAERRKKREEGKKS